MIPSYSRYRGKWHLILACVLIAVLLCIFFRVRHNNLAVRKQIFWRVKAVGGETFSENGYSTEVMLRTIFGTQPFSRNVGIDVNGCELAPNDVELFVQAPALRFLDLGNTNITDSEIESIARARSLTYLVISHTDISDNAVDALGQLRGLTTLEMSDTRITEEGLSTLRERLPHCRIHTERVPGRASRSRWL
jgi:hypothetical protein